MDAGFITWKQTVVISCNWTPGSRMYGDITVGDGESVYSNAAYADIVALEGMVFAFSRFRSTKPAVVTDLWCPLSFYSITVLRII